MRMTVANEREQNQSLREEVRETSKRLGEREQEGERLFKENR